MLTSAQVTNAIYWQQVHRFQTMLRAGLVTLIYDSTLELRAETLRGSAAITLAGTDVQRVVDQCAAIHELWASLVEVAVGIWLLNRQVGLASLVPVVVAVCKKSTTRKSTHLLISRSGNLHHCSNCFEARRSTGEMD